MGLFGLWFQLYKQTPGVFYFFLPAEDLLANPHTGHFFGLAQLPVNPGKRILVGLMTIIWSPD